MPHRYEPRSVHEFPDLFDEVIVWCPVTEFHDVYVMGVALCPSKG